MNYITKLKAQQWVESSLQLTQLYRQYFLKSNFIVPPFLSMESF